MTEEDSLKSLLKNSRNIAVVGVSRDPGKASYAVAAYLKKKGYKIIPVNPFADEILGEKSYKNISSIKERVDIVDIFRPGEDVYQIVKNAIRLKPGAIWMQKGITNLKAKKLAEKYNIKVIMDRCIMAEHKRLIDHNGSR
jgi:uncharacterized protein